jgi:hypothetical protein
MDVKLISCRECDRIYRLRHGTTSAAAKSGQIPHRQRGRAIMVSAKRAAEIWGTKLQEGLF